MISAKSKESAAVSPESADPVEAQEGDGQRVGPAVLGDAGAHGRSREASEQEPTEFQRLDRSTIWLPCAETAVGTVLPVFFVGFFVGHLTALFFAVGFVIVPTAVWFVLRFLTFRYGMSDSALVLESGVLFRRERRIPLEKIQEVAIQRTIVHRLLGLSKTQISTAGSDAVEVHLNVQLLADAERLKRAVANRQGEPHVAGTSDATCLVELSHRDLVLGGLSSRLVATVGALVAALIYFQSFVEIFPDWGMDRWMNQLAPLEEAFDARLPQDGILGTLRHLMLDEQLGKTVVLVVVGLFFSVAHYVIRYHGFRLTRTENMLEKTHGLLTVHRNSLASDRVQALKIEEGLLRRWFRLAAIRVDSAGDRKEVDEQKKRDALVPVIAASRAEALAAEAVPDLLVHEPSWEQISPRAILRGSKKGWLLTLGLMGSTIVPLGWAALAWLPVFPLVYLLNYKWFQHTHYHLDDQHLICRTGWLNRATLYLPVRNVQNVRVEQSFFDRRLQLATLKVDTAGQSNTGGGPVLKHLPLEIAQRMQRRLAISAAQCEPVL